MRITGRLFFLFAILFFGDSMYAQTVVWSVPLSSSRITPLSKMIYKIQKTDGQIAVYRFDGTEICQGVDSVTTFSEGISLLLKREDGRFSVWRFLLEDGTLFEPQLQGIYAGDYAFFSEGLLPVFNRKGKYGFVDRHGKEIIKFDYTGVHPFSEGLASVSRSDGLIKRIGNSISGGSNDFVIYVDTEGKELRVDKSLGRIRMGTSFYEGEALVRTEDSRFCFIDRQGRLLREKESVDIIYDWKFRLSGQDSPFQYSDEGISDLKMVEKDGLFGYMMSDDKWLLPPQFVSASPFNKMGYAVVSPDGLHSGILKLIDERFTISQEKETGKTDHKEGEEAVVVIVSVPQSYQSIPLSVEAHFAEDVQSYPLPIEQDSIRSVHISIPVEDRSYHIKAGDLLLAIQDYEPLTPDANLTFSINKKVSRADKNDCFYVDILVTNPGRHPFKGDFSIKGRGFVCKTKWIDIKPGETQRISGFFTRVIRRETRSVTVSVQGVETVLYVSLVPIIG